MSVCDEDVKIGGNGGPAGWLWGSDTMTHGPSYNSIFVLTCKYKHIFFLAIFTKFQEMQDKQEIREGQERKVGREGNQRQGGQKGGQRELELEGQRGTERGQMEEKGQRNMGEREGRQERRHWQERWERQGRPERQVTGRTRELET